MAEKPTTSTGRLTEGQVPPSLPVTLERRGSVPAQFAGSIECGKTSIAADSTTTEKKVISPYRMPIEIVVTN